jgi:hypothetical protein
MIMGYGVVQLVETLCYKPEGRGFDSLRSHWDFYGPGVDSASKRNEYRGSSVGAWG